MKKIIAWLREIEQRASDIYSTAAESFPDDKKFASFLNQLSLDEKAHCQMLDRAAEHFAKTGSSRQPEILLDPETVALVEGPLNELVNHLQNNKSSRQDIIKYIAQAELSEWNEIFLYVIHSSRKESRDVQYAAAAIQAHEQRIINFFNSLPPALKPKEDLLRLPRIWEDNILVVDDDEPLRVLMSSVLSTLGNVESAANGKEALHKTKNKFYNIILSDIDMPEMDGIEFLQKALEIDRRLLNHFIFCSGDLTVERKKLLISYGIPHLQKPFNIFELKRTAQKILDTAI